MLLVSHALKRTTHCCKLLKCHRALLEQAYCSAATTSLDHKQECMLCLTYTSDCYAVFNLQSTHTPSAAWNYLNKPGIQIKSSKLDKPSTISSAPTYNKPCRAPDLLPLHGLNSCSTAGSHASSLLLYLSCHATVCCSMHRNYYYCTSCILHAGGWDT